MGYLLFMDGLRENAVWMVLALLISVAALLIWAPRMSKSWRRKVVRMVGSVLLGCVTLLSAPLIFFALHDSRREHFVFKSADGSRVALLSHSELRDSAATEVAISKGCCSRYIAYRYYGDDDDYMGAKSVEWLDNNHLAIHYARDSSGVQNCQSVVADVQVLCDSRPAPFSAEKPARH